MKKIYISLAVSLVVINISMAGCAGENIINDNQTNIPAIENEEELEIEDIEEIDQESITDQETESIESDKEREEGRFRSNNAVEVSIERVDKSILDDDGQMLAVVYYDKPVITGDTEAARKINAFFEDEERSWFEGNSRLNWDGENEATYFAEGLEIMRERYGDEVIAVSPAKYTIDTRIKYLDENVLSILQIKTFSLEQFNWYYYGAAFDLSTGELLPITKVIDINADEMKKIIVDATYDTSGYYQELGDGNYDARYYDKTFDMRYEYFYDGEYYYIIDNLGGYYRDGVLIRWNGKWGEEYDVTALQYILDLETEEWVINSIMNHNYKKNILIDQIKSGDFSNIEESDIASTEELNNVYKNIVQDTEWILRDLNNDGVDDLIWQEKSVTDDKKAIIGIFDIASGGKCIFLDVAEMTEYYFIANNGNLLYYSQYFGIYSYISYERYIYDKSWNLKLEDGLYVYNICDIDDITYWFDKHDHTDMVEKGIYFKSYSNGAEKTMTEDEFEKSFEELTQMDYEIIKKNQDLF